METNGSKLNQATVAGSKVLLTATVEWPIVSILAIGLARAGSDISVVCPARCPLPKEHTVRRVFHHRNFNPLKSLIEAIKATRPEIIIPCDDQAVQQLHELHAWARGGDTAGNEIAVLIEKSLGSPESYPIVSSRCDLLKVAHEAGLRVPDTQRIRSTEGLKIWQDQHPLPWVLKVDGTFGGYGVRIANSFEQADQCFLGLNRLFNFGRVFKRLCVDEDAFRLWPWWHGAKPAVSIQSYIRGQPANCAAVCWEGQVLAVIAVEVVSTVGPTGRASVVRISDNTEMITAAERIAARLNLSGFFGLDFMIEEATGFAYLIEMNPRLARPFHLQLGKGRDLIGALCAKISGRPSRELPPVTQNRMIAYFPEAWQSDSQFLASSYHDIPEEEPDLVQQLRQTKQRNFLWRLMNQAGPMKLLRGVPGPPATSAIK